jgi:hypothetical protein
VATVVDQLIVTLGLDANQFKKGSDAAERSLKGTKDTFKKSSEAMTKSIVDVARNIAIAFVGFESASGLINFLAKINQAQASLSRMALNFGVSARALDVWDKKIELAGGSVAGAQSAINQLNQDVTALLTQGEVSPLLVFLQKLGIRTMDSANQARDARQVYEEMFAVLGKLPRAQAYQLATQAGINPDVLSYGLRPLQERQALTAEALRLSKATDANAKEADNLRMRWVEIQQSIAAIGVTFLEKITPSIERMLPVVEKFAIAAADWISTFGTKKSTPGGTTSPTELSIDPIGPRPDSVKDKAAVLDRLKRLFAGTLSVGAPNALIANVTMGAGQSAWAALKRLFSWTGGAPYMEAFRAATDKYKLPPGLLELIADRESHFDPNAVGAAGERGIMGLLPKYHPNAGKDVTADIDEAAKTLAALLQQFGGNVAAATAAYNAGSGRISKALAGQATVPVSTQQYVASIGTEMSMLRGLRGGAVPAASAGPVSNNTFEINVTTRDPANGKQIAADFVSEMKKRDLVMQTDSGMIP